MASCMQQNSLNVVELEFDRFFENPNAVGLLLILATAMFVAYWLSQFVARIIIRIGQLVSVRADNTASDSRVIQLRRVETYLSVTVALVRALIVAAVAYIVWQELNPGGSNSAATIGASAFFIVLAGGTINPLLRDMTAGANMIIERWFTVGDFIRVEPFMDLGGVVERVTLRSTRLRSLNGEVIWLHNQHIQGVRVTPHGVRTIAVDIFVNNKERGEALVKNVTQTIPTGTLTIASRLRVLSVEKWGEELWRITVVGQTPPGREWLIENYFVDTIIDMDTKSRKNSVLVHKPLVRFADPAAERSFKRAVRVKKQEQ